MTAEIFWMKTRAKWTDRPELQDDYGETIEGEVEETEVSDREVARRIAFVLDKGLKAGRAVYWITRANPVQGQIARRGLVKISFALHPAERLG